LGTSLRRGDIDSLKINDIDFEKNSINTKSRKGYLKITSATSVGKRYARVQDWLILSFMIYVRPLVPYSLKTVYRRLLHSDF
jgi:hypothetical protein